MRMTVPIGRPRPAEQTPILSVEGLTISVRGREHATTLVEDVSFSLDAGRTLCLVGESGCGKSITSLAVMGLLASPPLEISAGEILFEGRDLRSLPARERADLRGDRMTMIFQEPMTSLNPAFTIGDQISEVVLRHRRSTPAQARETALDMLRKVRIPSPEKRLDEFPHQLSGGMRQRIMIAMALANGPRLLIADEPTTALDVTIQAQILSLVRALQQETGTAMLLITHDLGVVAEVADDVAVMYAGRIVERAPVREIFADPQHPYTIGLMGSLPSLTGREERLATIPGSVPPADRMPKGCRFAPRCPFAIAACTTAPPPLVEVAPGHEAACIRAPLELHVTEAA
ncbi:ABC transporter ATP-binding protein [Alsobacter sp. KACC 23698]|uniref:ABC transporter ATP-binding protein n=1 Tax=Alsobacter sp. KACC 23698 TaxID=3149229 RepID=A0AAU7JKD2_9HYPH